MQRWKHCCMIFRENWDKLLLQRDKEPRGKETDKGLTSRQFSEAGPLLVAL